MAVAQLTPQGRSFGVDVSFYDPRDRAVTLAVFTKEVTGLDSVGEAREFLSLVYFL